MLEGETENSVVFKCILFYFGSHYLYEIVVREYFDAQPDASSGCSVLARQNTYKESLI